MLPEWGNLLLCLATGLSLLLAWLPMWGSVRRQIWLMRLAAPLASGVFLCVAGAFLILVHACVVNDFSVSYVAENSNSQLPVWYRVAASWGAHQGSILMWTTILSLWTFVAAFRMRTLTDSFSSRVLAVMGMINFGILLFVVFTSNPFSRTYPKFPIEGQELNPMLQDIGMIFHPPLLYLGYVGLSRPFAFAIAALLEGRIQRQWILRMRPWTQMAWIFLTLGIVLGSAWAYYVLGWGGWWFWDPVENASLMPWLVSTALLHSMAVTERRGGFSGWTIFLAIVAFSLSLLGTFLVRSGVLISVHAFTADPSRGLFLLLLLLVTIGGSLLLFALRGSRLRGAVPHTLWSRETFLLGNNILLFTAMLVVLVGTLLPLIHKELGLGSISVGEPFFNTLFSMLMAPFALLLGIAPLVRWRRDGYRHLLKRITVALIFTVVLAIALPLWLEDRIEAITLVGVSMAIWVAILTLMALVERASQQGARRGLAQIKSSEWGMLLAHLGVAILVFGITFSKNYSIERDVRLATGASVAIHDYVLTFKGIETVYGPNWEGGEGIFEVGRAGQKMTQLHAEKRFYPASQTMMSEAAIDGNPLRDLYLVLGEKQEDGSWSMRISYKPFVRWIWYGGVLMALGGVLCVCDRRYRSPRTKKEDK